MSKIVRRSMQKLTNITISPESKFEERKIRSFRDFLCSFTSGVITTTFLQASYVFIRSFLEKFDIEKLSIRSVFTEHVKPFALTRARNCRILKWGMIVLASGLNIRLYLESTFHFIAFILRQVSNKSATGDLWDLLFRAQIKFPRYLSKIANVYVKEDCIRIGTRECGMWIPCRMSASPH